MEHHRDHHHHRWVFISIGAFLGMMLLASIWQRFNEPSLVVHTMQGSHAQSGQRSDGTGMPGMAGMGGGDNGMAAIGMLMETVAKNPHDLASLLRLTESLMAVGKWESAENFAMKALDEPGRSPRAMYLLAVIHHNKGQHAEAAELLEKLLEREENPSARYSLAILFIHFLNKPEEGREQLEKGIIAEGVPPALIAAMQEELGKLPPAPDKQEPAPQAAPAQAVQAAPAPAQEMQTPPAEGR